jgi:asparagine synthase (glutamine-hydrolysing)
MCGILGGVNTGFTAEHLDRLQHRGPDQSKFVTLQTESDATIQLGQNRLNIVDREDIDLPVGIGDAVILFNGEIYNYRDIREELRNLGWTFETRTDTEVALAAYLQWGPDCLQRFNGMFALAIWDGGRFFLARDRMGKKPLFCRMNGAGFSFASEIKAFDNLQLVQQDLFDLFEFVFNEHTIYRDIYAVKPGHYVVYDVERASWISRAYWDIEQRSANRITNPRTAVNAFLELLEDAVRLRMQADVDVTLFLSGGLDSSLIAGLSGVRDAFTCQFTEFRSIVNELHYVRDLAPRLDINVNVVSPTRDEFFQDLSTLSYHLEMPTGSFSVFPLYRLAKACHDRGYKAVLSGEGSDELFGGYVRNEHLVNEANRDLDDKARHYASMLGRYDGSDLDRFCRMASRAGLTDAALMKMFLIGLWDERRSALENICYIESRIFLQPLLQMSDRMCMAHSVEARCPFLDHRLVEFAFSLDDTLRHRDGSGKWIVQEAARKVLPKGCRVLERTVKDGLPAPINLWLHGQHSFDRRYWNSIMMAECMKSLLSRRSDASPRTPSGVPTPPALDLPTMPRRIAHAHG